MKIKRTTLKIVLLIILIMIIFVIFYKIFLSEPDKVCIEDKKCFNIEIADTNEKRTLGLSNRNFLEENQGMLFVFEEEIIPGFWMNSMNFPIDIIWINKKFNIVGIEKNLQPCNSDFCQIFYSPEEIIYVLEINSGFSEQYGFEIGNKILLK